MMRKQRRPQDSPPQYDYDDRYDYQMQDMHNYPPEYPEYYPEEGDHYPAVYPEEGGPYMEDYPNEYGAHPDQPSMVAMQPYEEEEPRVTAIKPAHSQKSGFHSFVSHHMCIAVGVVVIIIMLIIIFVTNAVVERDWNMPDNRDEGTYSIFNRPPNRNTNTQ